MIRYELKSAPGVGIAVPQSYGEKAEALIKGILEGPASLPSLYNDYPDILGIPGILADAVSLAYHPTSAPLQDAVYLRVCVNQNERNGAGLEPRHKAELDDSLDRLLKSVVSKS